MKLTRPAWFKLPARPSWLRVPTQVEREQLAHPAATLVGLAGVLFICLGVQRLLGWPAAYITLGVALLAAYISELLA